MFKYNKITALWTATLAVSSIGNQALAAEETLVVTAGSSEDPTAPLKGIVATRRYPRQNRRRDRQNAAVSIGGYPRSNARAGRHLGIQALRYSAGVFTEYRGSSNRNDEVFVRGFSYVPKFLDGLSYGATASSQTGTFDPWLLERVELVRGPASVLFGG